MDVAALVGAAKLYAAGTDRVAHASHDEALLELRRASIAKRDDLGEVVLGIDVQQRGTESGRDETPSLVIRSITMESLPPEKQRRIRC